MCKPQYKTTRLYYCFLQERERLKKEKKDEKRLNKERKLEIRRLELEKAKELKKPNEDMCLADHKVFTHCGAVGR